MPALYRIHEPPDPLKVHGVRRVRHLARLRPRRAADGGVRPIALPAAGRSHPRHARRASDRVPDAADDAEGALRLDQRRPLRAGRRDLHALHVADPPLSGPGRAPPAARAAADAGRATSGATSSTTTCPEIGRHTSDMERRAAEAERELVQWKKVRFMADKVGDVFDGYITGVAPFGLFVELIEHYVEGLVHVSTMADDYYRLQRADPHAVRREHEEALPARRQGRGAGRARRPRTPPDRSGHRGRPGGGAADERRRGPGRSQARPKKDQRKGTPEQRRKIKSGGSAGRSSAAARKRSASRRSRSTKRLATACRAHRRRHRRPHRSREERARARAHRHRSRSAEGGEGARHHHRAGVCPHRAGRT